MAEQHPVLVENPGLFHLGGDVFAALENWKGLRHLDIREWFRAADGKWYRTKRGVKIDFREVDRIAAMVEWAKTQP